MGKMFKIFGMVFFLIGMVILFNSFQGITGFAVSENVDVNLGFVLGIWFVLTAVLLLAYRRKEKIDNAKRK